VEEALAQYNAALRYVDENLLMQVDGPHLEFANAARAPTLLNMAACHLRREDWSAAAGSASEALSSAACGGESTKELRCKALFRRGQARRSMQQTEGAVQDLTAALELCGPQSSKITGPLLGLSDPLLQTCFKLKWVATALLQHLHSIGYTHRGTVVAN
jgi:tetratricopeptide (TPR) repeat protein